MEMTHKKKGKEWEKWWNSYREDVFTLDLGHMWRVDEFQFLNGALQNKK